MSKQNKMKRKKLTHKEKTGDYEKGRGLEKGEMGD